MKRVDVVSSNVHSVGYDEPSSTLEVQFKNNSGGPGNVYQYAPVSRETYDAIVGAESVGRALNALVKGDPSVTTTAVVDAQPEAV